MTPDAQKILDMIKAVDPSDTAKLDEIDARVWCWLVSSENNNPRIGDDCKTYTKKLKWNPLGYTIQRFDGTKYTRSRDALKGIRPDGWDFQINTKNLSCRVTRKKLECNSEMFTAKTEELSELCAIVFAISKGVRKK